MSVSVGEVWKVAGLERGDHGSCFAGVPFEVSLRHPGGEAEWNTWCGPQRGGLQRCVLEPQLRCAHHSPGCVRSPGSEPYEKR